MPQSKTKKENEKKKKKKKNTVTKKGKSKRSVISFLADGHKTVLNNDKNVKILLKVDKQWQ